MSEVDPFSQNALESYRGKLCISSIDNKIPEIVRSKNDVKNSKSNAGNSVENVHSNLLIENIEVSKDCLFNKEQIVLYFKKNFFEKQESGLANVCIEKFETQINVKLPKVSILIIL